MTAPFDARLDVLDARPTVTLRGAFDVDAVARFDEVMADARACPGDVVLDLSAVTDATVDGVEAMVGAATRLTSRRRRLVVVGRPGLLRHLLALGVGDVVRVRGPSAGPSA
jgi:anti-anti-sigma regulatory factor